SCYTLYINSIIYKCQSCEIKRSSKFYFQITFISWVTRRSISSLSLRPLAFTLAHVTLHHCKIFILCTCALKQRTSSVIVPGELHNYSLPWFRCPRNRPLNEEAQVDNFVVFHCHETALTTRHPNEVDSPAVKWPSIQKTSIVIFFSANDAVTNI
ncbi:hypothetical protein L9F63_012768, partial [Diploptera punctata]